MSLLARLALLFVIVPILELALLIQVGQLVGLWPTLALVVLTGVGGAALARSEGLRAFWAFQQQMSRGEIPGQAILDGLCVLLGGAFLLTPGLVTDVVGLSLLFPPSRRMIQGRLRRVVERRIQEGSVHFTVFRAGEPGRPEPEGEPEYIDLSDREIHTEDEGRDS
jgi:UPF0716 protein FxsA